MPIASDLLVDKTRLVVSTIDNLLVSEAGRFLVAIDDAYLGIQRFQHIHDFHYLDKYTTEARLMETLGKYDPTPHLFIARVNVNSPGRWEFLGSLNPLEVIRRAINDYHERQKDYSYRNSAEKQKLALDNALLQIELIKKELEFLRDAGVPEHEIQKIAIRLVQEPIHKLQRESSITTEAVIERD